MLNMHDRSVFEIKLNIFKKFTVLVFVFVQRRFELFQRYFLSIRQESKDKISTNAVKSVFFFKSKLAIVYVINGNYICNFLIIIKSCFK